MVDRPDVVLAAIPLLAVSGVVVRTAVGATGVASGLLAAPLAPIGYAAALALICWEVITTSAAGRARERA
ncbi:hypothetical protein [Halovivax sp.]|uniref:hypothetical protein n=1 Tax=Halovivax sp. TaxID=1935978 RepID=UPI0025BBAAFF|nr:hypothetical protein [Halovivax sp.]